MSERIRACESASQDCASEVHEDLGLPPKKGVRETSELQTSAAAPSPVASPLAHPSDRLTLQLNTNWRVLDDSLQWVLQRRKGNPRKKNSGWKDRSFCTTRDALLRCVHEYCGEVEQSALADLQALPDHHADVEQPK
jgi:hypothetical protein